MKNLSISNSLDEVTIEDFYNLKIPIPSFLSDFIGKYGGKSTVEYRFFFNKYYVVNNFLPIKSLRNASIELILPAIQDSEEGIGRNDLIPFAIDPGGNPFYVSIGESDYGNVYIDTITSRGFEEPILKIANSFEEFIDGLQPESTQA